MSVISALETLRRGDSARKRLSSPFQTSGVIEHQDFTGKRRAVDYLPIMQEETSSWRVTVWFDGSCPMCRREIAHYRKIDRRRQVRFIDLSQDSNLLNALGVATETGMRRMHVLRADGVIVNGAHAFVAMWRQLPGYRWLASFLEAARVTALLDWLYERFARRRFRHYRRRAGGDERCLSQGQTCSGPTGEE